jgi:hypothetical protein
MVADPEGEAVKTAEVLELVSEGKAIVWQRVKRTPDFRRRPGIGWHQLQEEDAIPGHRSQHFCKGLGDEALRNAPGSGGNGGKPTGAIEADLRRAG